MNLKTGMIRIWVSLSLIWLIFSTFQILSSQHEWTTSYNAGKTLSELVNKERKSITEDIVSRQKQSNNELKASGIKMPFDEIAAENAAYGKALDYLKTTDNYKWYTESFEHAFAARDRRDLFLKIALLIPVAIGFLMLLVGWVITGFQKPTQIGNS